MKICIFGAGAIGGYMGVDLTLAGHDVALVARGAHLEAMRANGLRLITDAGERVTPVHATDRPADLGPQDYLIVALKAHQAWDAAEAMTPLIGPDTTVVTAMNGVPWWYFWGLEGPYANLRLESVDPGERQWRLLGPERAIGCVVYPATELVGPGIVRHIYGDKFTLGEPDNSQSQRCQALSQAMQDAGFKAPVAPSIRNEIWLKLWGNLCFNPISALTRATLDVVATDPGTRNTARAMMIEAQRIGARLGVHFRVDVERRINGAARVGAHRTSMLQDLERGRALEIDALLTAVQEMGRLTDVDTPYIDTVLGLVQQMARTASLYPTFPEPQEEESPGDLPVD